MKSNVSLGSLTTPAFQMAFNRLMESDISAKASYSLTLIAEGVAQHMKHCEEMRQKLLTKHGELDADGKVRLNESGASYMLRDSKGFDKEYAELLAVEVEIPKIPLSWLEGVAIKPVMMAALVRTVVDPAL